MAEQDTIICIGSSNMAGYNSNLYDVPDSEYIRWFSDFTPTSSTPARPYVKQASGVRMWTPRRPYSTNERRPVGSIGGGGTTITYTGTAISPTPTADQWTFISKGTGAGNIRKITGVAGQVLTVTPALSPTPVAGDTAAVLLDSHTLSSIDSTKLIVTKTGTSPAFTSAVVGRFVSFFDSLPGGERVGKIADWTATTLTLDFPLSSSPAAGTGFCVLSGANACESISTMQPPNAVLQNLQFTLDNVSPVYLTGLDYSNWDFTAFGSPRSLSNDPTVNSVTELAWQIRSKIGEPLVCIEVGVSASMISPFALNRADTAIWAGPFHDSTNLDFHPSIPSGLYKILENAIASTKTLIEAEGNTMKVRGIFINLFDNDPTSGGTQRIYRLRANTELLRDSLRTLLGDENVPWIMSGPSAYAGGPTSPINAFVYDQLFAIAKDDPQSAVADTRVGFTYCVEDSLHLDALGQIKLGQEFFRAWEPVHDAMTGSSPSVDICNRALTAIGEAPNITSLDPPEGSAHAQLCASMFKEATKIVADSRHWTFADRRVTLEKVRLQLPMILDATSNLITTALPHGLVIGSPVTFAVAASGAGTVPSPLKAGQVYYVATASPSQFNVTSTVGGYGTAIVFTTVGTGAWRCFKESDRDGSAFMYALPSDCRTERGVVPVGAPDDWPGMDGTLVGTPYAGVGVVTTSRDGTNYSLDSGGFGPTKPIPWKRAISRGGDQVIYTSLEAADLIYSKNLDDATQWPPLFQEAVVFQLAAGLAGAIKRDVKIVDWCLGRSQSFISEAARVDGQRVVERDRQRYPWAR